MKIAINRTVGYIDERVLKNIFDVERLKQSLQPDRVEDQAGKE